MSPVIGYCWHCYEWHRQALRYVQEGEPPSGCQICGTPMETLHAIHGDAVVMRVYRKDGIYQMACDPCGEEYERKNLPMFGQTPHGLINKLAGAK